MHDLLEVVPLWLELQDLIDEWASDSKVDLFSFVPYTVEFAITISDSFEIFLLLNENNWIDTT